MAHIPVAAPVTVLDQISQEFVLHHGEHKASVDCADGGQLITICVENIQTGDLYRAELGPREVSALCPAGLPEALLDTRTFCEKLVLAGLQTECDGIDQTEIERGVSLSCASKESEDKFDIALTVFMGGGIFAREWAIKLAIPLVEKATTEKRHEIAIHSLRREFQHEMRMQQKQIFWLSLAGGAGFSADKQLERFEPRTVITSIPECIYLEPLKVLNIHACRRLPLDTVDQVCQHLTLLESLNLSYLDIKAIPDTIGRCTALTSLNLSSCKLSTIPDTIGRCTALTSLNLSSCKLSAIPDTIGGCTALIDLNLYDCTALTAIPDSIGGCTALTNLNLHSCSCLAVIPDTIKGCTALKSVGIYGLHGNAVARLQEFAGALARCEFAR